MISQWQSSISNGDYSGQFIWYSYIGDITIMGEVTFDSDQLTLTCISTGGPATTVTWTRDSTTTVTEGNETVLDDPETAQYTHNLTVTTGGVYNCTVENNKPSSDSATIILGGIYNYVDQFLKGG